MSNRRTHETTRLYWLPSVEDLEFPTSAEIAAGTELTDQTTADGIQQNSTRNNASVVMLAGGFTPEKPGTWSEGFTLRFTREEDVALGEDPVFDLFEYGTLGVLLISRTGEPASDRRVECYAGGSHNPTILGSAENAYQQFEVQITVDDVQLKAVVDGTPES